MDIFVPKTLPASFVAFIIYSANLHASLNDCTAECPCWRVSMLRNSPNLTIIHLVDHVGGFHLHHASLTLRLRPFSLKRDLSVLTMDNILAGLNPCRERPLLYSPHARHQHCRVLFMRIHCNRTVDHNTWHHVTTLTECTRRQFLKVQCYR